MLAALSGQIIIFVDPSVSEFEGLEVTATGMNVCRTWDIDREHYCPIAWSFLAYKAVIQMVGL